MLIERVVGIVGTSFYPGSWNLLQRCKAGCPLRIVRCGPDHPSYKYDKNAVAVMWGGKQLGHIPRGLAAELAPIMDAGTEITALKVNGPVPVGVNPLTIIGLRWDDGQPEEKEVSNDDPAA
jgi:hypothetical protein